MDDLNKLDKEGKILFSITQSDLFADPFRLIHGSWTLMFSDKGSHMLCAVLHENNRYTPLILDSRLVYFMCVGFIRSYPKVRGY